MIDGAIVRSLEPHGDARGYFVESYRAEWFPDGFAPVQANRAERGRGSVTGLHFHLEQADWWYVTRGRARMVLHDLRAGSPTAGRTMVVDVDPDGGDHRGIYVPRGVAHGFAALTDVTLTYLVDRYYDPGDEHGVAWDDPELAIDWGVRDPIVTARDQGNPRLADVGQVDVVR